MTDDKTKKIKDIGADVWESVASKGYAVKLRRDNVVLTSVVIKPGENLVGRMPENDIMIDDPEVSRSHARLVFSKESGTLDVEDMQSENGILVNDQRVTKKNLKVGDKIEIGSHVLEVANADEQSFSPQLEEQIEKAQNQQWRLDQTIAGSSPQAQEQIAKLNKGKSTDLYGTTVVSEKEQARIVEGLKKPQQASKKDDVLASGVSISLFLGSEKIKDIRFDYSRAIDPVREKNLEDAIYINVKIGDKIFGKKIKL